MVDAYGYLLYKTMLPVTVVQKFTQCFETKCFSQIAKKSQRIKMIKQIYE